MSKVGTIENEVLFGHDGYLFLAGGAHKVLENVSGDITKLNPGLNAVMENCRLRQNWASNANAKFLHVIMPDKQSVVPDLWPFPNPLSLADAVLGRSGEMKNYIYVPTDDIRAVGPRALSRVDTHLTGYGSLIVASGIVRRLESPETVMKLGNLDALEFAVLTTAGDLGSKLTPEQVESQERVLQGFPTIWLHNELSGGNNGIIDIRINRHAVVDKRCMIFGDSFGRDLAIYLSLWFKEVLFLRTPYFHPELADQMRPDHVITETVERYIPSGSRDEDRPPFLLFPHLSQLDYKPSLEFTQALAGILSYPRERYSQMCKKYGVKDRD